MLPNQNGSTGMRALRAMQRAWPVCWRSSAVGAGADLAWMIDRAIDLRAASASEQLPLKINAEAKVLLLAHQWTGNLRELTNVIGLAAAVCANQVTTAGDLLDYLVNLKPENQVGDSPPKDLSIHRSRAAALLNALRSCHWNVNAVAQNLDISRMTPYRRMKQHGILPPR